MVYQQWVYLLRVVRLCDIVSFCDAVAGSVFHCCLMTFCFVILTSSCLGASSLEQLEYSVVLLIV